LNIKWNKFVTREQYEQADKIDQVYGPDVDDLLIYPYWRTSKKDELFPVCKVIDKWRDGTIVIQQVKKDGDTSRSKRVKFTVNVGSREYWSLRKFDDKNS